MSVILSFTSSSPLPRRNSSRRSRLARGGLGAPPQRMIRSATGILRSLFQFLPELGQRDVNEVRRLPRCDPSFVVRFRIPAASELFDDLRSLAAVYRQCLAELAVSLNALELTGGLAAEKVAEVAFSEVGEEVSGQDGELLLGGEGGELPLNHLGRGPKQALSPLPQNGRETLRGAHLGHLAQVGSATGAADVVVNGVSEAADQFHQCRCRRDEDADSL